MTVIRLRRNFGQTAAFAAGFDQARGDVIITMDADLQNDPHDIPLLMAKVDEGYDIVSGWRKDRQDRFLDRRLPSMVANALIRWATGVRIHDYGCSLKAYRREVLADVRLYGEMHRFIPALAQAAGGRVTEVPVSHHPRRFGKAKYGLSRTLKVFLDILAVRFLMSYSTRPIHIFGLLGLLSFVVGMGVGAVSVEWEERSDTDTSLGTPLPGGGSMQSEEGTVGGLIINFGLGHRFNEVFDLRFQIPTFFIGGGEYRDGAVIPTFTITWKNRMLVTPTARSLPKESLDFAATSSPHPQQIAGDVSRPPHLAERRRHQRFRELHHAPDDAEWTLTEGQRRTPGRAEQVRDEGKVGPCNSREQDRGTAGSDHPTVDLGNLEARIHLDVHHGQIAVAAQPFDEGAQVREALVASGHGISTVEPVVFRDSRSRWAVAASSSG